MDTRPIEHRKIMKRKKLSLPFKEIDLAGDHKHHSMHFLIRSFCRVPLDIHVCLMVASGKIHNLIQFLCYKNENHQYRYIDKLCSLSTTHEVDVYKALSINSVVFLR